MSVFYDLSRTPRNILNQAIVRAIVSENNGLLFDIGDMSTLYQDAAGTTPVTVVEQPVGKMLDKSGNGYHATQPITASRPTLSARYNLLTKTENLADAAWAKTGATVTPMGFDVDIGAPSFLITETAVTSEHRLLNSTYPTCPAGSTVTATISIKAGTLSNAYLSLTDNSTGSVRAAFNLVSKTAVITASSGAWAGSSAAIADKGGGWMLISITATKTTGSASNICLPILYTQSGSTLGVTTNTLYATKFDIHLGATSEPYQRVNTATDYDTDERYFKKYLRFDGVDDYLNLPFMSLYAGGEMSIIAARNAVSQATDTYIISERSTTDADPKYFPSRQLASAGNMDAYISDDAGTVVLDTVGSLFSGVANAVIRSIVDSGNNLKLFKNGVLAANDNYTRSGALTLNNTTIGASVSTTTGNYASMKLYGLIITKSALNDSQRIACERYLGRKSGVQL